MNNMYVQQNKIVLSIFTGAGLLESMINKNMEIVPVSLPNGIDIEQWHTRKDIFYGIISKNILSDGDYDIETNIYEAVRIINEAIPLWFIIVTDTDILLPPMDGYICPNQILNASDFGASRHLRLKFWFGFRKDRINTPKRMKISGLRVNKNATDIKGHTLKEMKRAMGIPPDWNIRHIDEESYVYMLENDVPLSLSNIIAVSLKKYLSSISMY